MLTKKLTLILGLLLGSLLLAGCAANGATGTAAPSLAVAPTAAGALPAPVVEQNDGPTPSAATMTAVAALPAPPDATLAPADTPAPPPSTSPPLPRSPAPLPSSTPLGPQTINGVPLADIAPLPPETAANIQAIYAKGQALGRDPRALSKLGDSTLLNPHFLGPFDSGDYTLGDFGHLQATIDRWAGSFARHGVAARHGLHSWTVFDPMWADEAWCLPGEHLLACEFRLQNPSVLFVRLGSNDAGAPDGFRYNVKEVIEFCLEQGVIPIIGTKADRFEGSNENNDILRALAAEYHVPLWDFDRAAETLPNRGLDADGVHLVIDDLPHDYGDPAAFQRGHAVQDLTALVVLDGLRRIIEDVE
ncbi:hypothetical protein [Promineifilum sp.]|uniref:hypothetical protein n=1 Tax=Promineifilum sp. TaxID=2664178 RepID=UPI0035AFFC6B